MEIEEYAIGEAIKKKEEVKKCTDEHQKGESSPSWSNRRKEK